MIRLDKIKTEKSKESIAEKVPQEIDEEIQNMLNILPLESKEKVKHRIKLKILTPNKRLTRLLILLAQIKAGHDSYKLKSELIQTYLMY